MIPVMLTLPAHVIQMPRFPQASPLIGDVRGRICDRWEGELNVYGSRLCRQVKAQIEALRREKNGWNRP